MTSEYEETEETAKKAANLGPHGLGDPDDKTMRKVEENVLVPQIMRRIAKVEYCSKEVDTFNQCCKRERFMFAFRCQEENKIQQDCLLGWYNNDEFRQRCTKIYLEERTEYRRTGLNKKQKEYLASKADSESPM